MFSEISHVLICIDISILLIIDIHLNRAVLEEIRRDKNQSEQDSILKQKSNLLLELSVRLDWAGITDPLKKGYVEPPDINNISFIMFLLTVIQIHKLYFCKNTG